MRGSLFLILFAICCLDTCAQTVNKDDYPSIGKSCPDFILRNIRYFSERQATLKDFKGKWLVLDFWNKGCGACVASFPRVSAMQKEFGNKVQFIMVGIEDRENQIEPMFAKFRKKENLVMPCAFDSLLANRWDIYTAPHIIVLDDEGIVRAITSSFHKEDMQGFLSGNPPHLNNPFKYDWENDSRIPFDEKMPFLVNCNGGKDSVFLFRSLLSMFNGVEQHQFFPHSIAEDSAKGKFQVLGATLYNLYNYAYYGTTWPHDSAYHTYPVLEIKDSSLFKYNSYNEFCYSLLLPPLQATKVRMQKIMQQDLQNYFGYDTQIGERKFPYWRLVTSEAAKMKLKTKGGIGFYDMSHAGFCVRNYPIENLLDYVKQSLGLNGATLINETGIKGNIDITLDCIDTDFNDMKRALREKGLDLIQDEETLKVLVIKDPGIKSN
jgi:thiol-disulfide isomerase/thioredoxin